MNRLFSGKAASWGSLFFISPSPCCGETAQAMQLRQATESAMVLPLPTLGMTGAKGAGQLSLRRTCHRAERGHC